MNSIDLLDNGFTTPPELRHEIRAAFQTLGLYFPSRQLEAFRRTPYPYLVLYNYRAGDWMRRNLLKPGSPLYFQFCQAGFSDRREMSLVILGEFHQHLNAAPQKVPASSAVQG